MSHHRRVEGKRMREDDGVNEGLRMFSYSEIIRKLDQFYGQGKFSVFLSTCLI